MSICNAAVFYLFVHWSSDLKVMIDMIARSIVVTFVALVVVVKLVSSTVDTQQFIWVRVEISNNLTLPCTSMCIIERYVLLMIVKYFLSKLSM